VTVKLRLPDRRPGWIVLCRGAYGEVYSNLSGGIDFTSERFCRITPSREVWGALLEGAGGLELSRTACVCCGSCVELATSTAWFDLEEWQIRQLAEDHVVSPQARAVCPGCLGGLSKPEAFSLISDGEDWPSVVAEMTTRCLVGYAGALVSLWAPGQSVAHLFSLAHGRAQTLTAALFALGLNLVPWPWLGGGSSSRKDGAARAWAATTRELAGPLAGVALVALASLFVEPLPLAQASRFWWFDLHLGVLAGVAGALARSLTWRERSRQRSREVRERQLARMAHLGQLIPALAGAATRTDHDRAIDRLLVEGLLAEECQIFSLDRSEEIFRLARHHGSLPEKLRGFAFRAGDPHLPGLAAQRGRPLTTQEVLASSELSGRITQSVPSTVCFCSVFRGTSVEVYNISRMRHPEDLPVLRGLLEMIGLVAGQGPASSAHG
jgi:hypothetical protein